MDPERLMAQLSMRSSESGVETVLRQQPGLVFAHSQAFLQRQEVLQHITTEVRGIVPECL